MSPHYAPFQTLNEQEREQMRDLLDLLTAEPEQTTIQVHDKIRALAELNMLLAVHNANGTRFIRELVEGELERLRIDMHAIYDPLALILDRVGKRLDDMSARQEAMDERQNVMDSRLVTVETRQTGQDKRLDGVDQRMDRVELRTRLLTVMLIAVMVAGFLLSVGLHLLVP